MPLLALLVVVVMTTTIAGRAPVGINLTFCDNIVPPLATATIVDVAPPRHPKLVVVVRRSF